MTIKFLGLGQNLNSGLEVEAPSVKAVKALIDTKQDILTFSTGLTNVNNVVTLNKATPTALGGVIVPTNSNLNIDSNGNISVNVASTSQKGLIEIATDGEFTTGTSTTLAVTPKQVSSVASTLTNKSIDATKNTISNLAVANFLADAIALSITPNPDSASDEKLPTEKAVANLTKDFITLTDLSATAPIAYNNATGVISAILDNTPTSGSSNLVNSGNIYAAIQAALSGALVYQGEWQASGQTDFSAIPVPARRGYMYVVNGTTTTSDGRTWYTGDYLIINKDINSGTVTPDDVDQVDNTESPDLVRLNATQTLTNKTINALSNTITNLQLSNFASGVVQTIIRDQASASNTSIATEKAIATALAGKQDNLTFSTGLTKSGNTVTVTVPVASPTNQSGKFLTTDGTNTSWEEIIEKTYNSGYGIEVNEDTDTITNTAPNIQSDWNATTPATGQILNRPNLSKVATSNDYEDLDNTPVFGAGLTVSGVNVDVTYPLPAEVPTITGQSGKFLTTDGSGFAWAVPTDTQYTFSNGLTKDSNNNVTLNIAGSGLGGVKAGGANITIANDGTISAQDTTYTAGAYISISNNTITNTAPNIQSNWTATTASQGQILNKPVFSTGLTYQNNTLTVTLPIPDVSGKANQILTNDGTGAKWDNLLIEVGTVSSEPPANPSINDTYLDTDLNKIYTWDGNTWSNPQEPAINRVYIAMDNGFLYLYDGTVFKHIGGGETKERLDELNDVAITAAANDQILKYNNSTQKWENKDLYVATISYW